MNIQSSTFIMIVYVFRVFEISYIGLVYTHALSFFLYICGIYCKSAQIQGHGVS